MNEMNNDTRSALLNAAYELEGLVQISGDRPHLKNLIVEKARLILDLATELRGDTSETPVTEPEETDNEQLADGTEAEAAQEAEADPEPVAEADPEPEPAAVELPLYAEYFTEEDDEEVQEEIPQPETPEPEQPARIEPVSDRYARLRKMLSINDRFRFRRELFADSDSGLTSALKFLAQLDTIEEAEDYLYHDLDLNPDSPETAAFVAILDRYYA